jgi:DNA-binding NarL/FixJ family response regulator
MNSTYSPIRLVIADDHEFFREGFSSLLYKHAKQKIQIIGEARNGLELIDLVHHQKPDVVVTDIKMPEMDGIEAARKITRSYPNLGVIALSTFDESAIIYEALQAGVKGYILKDAPKEEIIEAIEIVNKGLMYYCNTTSRHLVRLIANSKFNCFPTLGHLPFNDLQISLIKLICQQLTTKEIADELHLSVRAIEDQIKKIKEKTDARNTVGIALFAIKNSIITLKDF